MTWDDVMENYPDYLAHLSDDALASEDTTDWSESHLPQDQIDWLVAAINREFQRRGEKA